MWCIDEFVPFYPVQHKTTHKTLLLFFIMSSSTTSSINELNNQQQQQQSSQRPTNAVRNLVASPSTIEKSSVVDSTREGYINRLVEIILWLYSNHINVLTDE